MLNLNSYCQDIAKLMFPNIKIIIDRFHIVAMMTRSFNQTRVQAFKKYDNKSLEYRKLKFA
ncbi:transposase (plasmid) [Paucilactobacillus suebicus]|uniref:transposase n=1 Tax=Paucilactobacillus suebicus TaxID=152335 RepID=UPI0009782594|nr:transposase [Paucilactobacillus suebicus]